MKTPISIPEMLACAMRELRLRQNVYPRWVEGGRMTAEKAAYEIECIEAIVAQLERAKLLAEVTEEFRADARQRQEQSELGIVFDFCPHCRSSFSFRAPIGGQCGWCGQSLTNPPKKEIP